MGGVCEGGRLQPTPGANLGRMPGAAVEAAVLGTFHLILVPTHSWVATRPVCEHPVALWSHILWAALRTV
jgi:hypothetical protein